METSSDVKFSTECKPETGACVVLQNGRFVDVINGNYFDKDINVVVKEERIAAIPGYEGTYDEIKPDFVVDLKGKTVLPGLINTHCHTTQALPSLLPHFRDIKFLKRSAEQQMEKNLTECLAHGITTIRDAWAADLRILRSLQNRIRTNELAGPRILQTVVVGPPGGYLTERYGVVMKWMRSWMGLPTVDYGVDYSGSIEFDLNATEQQVRDTVDRAIDERGAEVIKVGEQKENMITFKPDATIMTLKQLSAIADQSRKRGLKSTIHHTSAASFRRALKAGISSLAHLAIDELLTEEDIALFLSQACMIEPTMSLAYDTSYRIRGHPAFDDPHLAMLTEFRDRVHSDLVEEFWLPELQAGALGHHSKANREQTMIFGVLSVRKMFEHYVSNCTTGARNLKLLFESGARMTVANDGGLPPCTPAMMQHEVRLLHLFLNDASSMNRFRGVDAVRMATINGAECLGLEADFGSITVGKVADLVILDGDPLEDHQVVGSRVAALFKDGNLVINNCGLQVTPTSSIDQPNLST